MSDSSFGSIANNKRRDVMTPRASSSHFKRNGPLLSVDFVGGGSDDGNSEKGGAASCSGSGSGSPLLSKSKFGGGRSMKHDFRVPSSRSYHRMGSADTGSHLLPGATSLHNGD